MRPVWSYNAKKEKKQEKVRKKETRLPRQFDMQTKHHLAAISKCSPSFSKNSTTFYSHRAICLCRKGKSVRGKTANLIRNCSLITNPQAPQFPELEPKPLVISVQACMAWNKEKTLGQCQVELQQAAFNWATTGMPSSIRVPSERLKKKGFSWAVYGLVAEATLDEISSGISVNGSGKSAIKMALAKAMSKQLIRNDLPEKALKIVDRQFGRNCVVPSTRGYQYEGKYEWSCGSFSADPKICQLQLASSLSLAEEIHSLESHGSWRRH